MERVVAGGDDQREQRGRRDRSDAGGDIVAAADELDRLGAGERGDDRARFGDRLGLDRDDHPVGAVGVQHRADDPAEHRLAGNVDEAFVTDAARLGERIEIAPAGGEDEDVGARTAHRGLS